MRQLSITFLLILVSVSFITKPAFSAVKGGINYSIPVYYNNLSEEEIKTRADNYFNTALTENNGELSENITNALVAYTVLQKINPEKALYSVKLGILYEKIGKDRYAKGNFYRAISTEPDDPMAYFYFGEYYYHKQMYRKALKFYNEALTYDRSNNSELQCRLKDIQNKLGAHQNTTRTIVLPPELKPVSNESDFDYDDTDDDINEL